MKKTIILLILIVILLSGCSKSVSSPVPVTSTQTLPAPTNTESPTSIPTVTPDPLAGAPEGTTGINTTRQWIKTVTQNGHEYEYTFNAELEQWAREAANFPLWDSTKFNYLPFRIFFTDGTLGERSVLEIAHTDVISDNDPSPLRSTFKPELEQRYFGLGNLESASNELSIQLQQEMMKGLESQAYVPIILSNGEVAKVKLSTETGLILTIIDLDTLTTLGGEHVSTWHDGDVTFYLEVYGVDAQGNMLCRIAFEKSIGDISDEVLRDVLFTFPGNFVDHIDQREQGFTNTAQIFSMYSEKPRADGTPDISFVRVPITQP